MDSPLTPTQRAELTELYANAAVEEMDVEELRQITFDNIMTTIVNESDEDLLDVIQTRFSTQLEAYENEQG